MIAIACLVHAALIRQFLGRSLALVADPIRFDWWESLDECLAHLGTQGRGLVFVMMSR